MGNMKIVIEIENTAAPRVYVRDTDGQYTVQKGDTLSAIAAAFGTSVGEIVDRNHIANADLIFPAQRFWV